MRWLPIALLALVCATGPAVTGPPDEHEGLVAWYRIDSLHRNHNNGELVLGWPDSSGQSRGLVAHPDGVRAVFETRQVNLEPVVRMRANTAFQIERPFELQDHTIFVVYDASVTRRAFFHDDTEDRRGLVLLDLKRHHRFTTGDPQGAVSYTGRPVAGKQFSITMLTRAQGVLGCFVNGEDYSSGVEFDEPIRVGGFFFVRPTMGGRGDADTLRVAEMIFYNRRLDENETTGVTAYLSEKYGIDVAAQEPVQQKLTPGTTDDRTFLPPVEQAQAWLGTQSQVGVNSRAVVILWESQLKLEAPFRHDPGEETGSRLVCTRDGTRLELLVALPVRTTAKGTRVQLLILKNGNEYLDEYGDSGLLRGTNPKRATIEFKTTLELSAGDYIEVVARGIGEPGPVNVDPFYAALVARAE